MCALCAVNVHHSIDVVTDRMKMTNENENENSANDAGATELPERYALRIKLQDNAQLRLPLLSAVLRNLAPELKLCRAASSC